MQNLISPQDMLACEKRYFDASGVPSIDIMENAALALVRAVYRKYPGAQHICIACGPGGNGGDGYAAARLLAERGKQCYIFAAAEARSADAIANAQRARECGVEILPVNRLQGMPLPDVWIDCLYGTGLSRAPEGDAALLIDRINSHRAAGSAVVACDIPSGLNGCTGMAYSPCVQADLTITFQRAKYGHFLQDGLDMCGEVEVAGVGFPEDIFPDDDPLLLKPEDLRGLFAPRRRNIHKGSCGHLLIVAGSVGMAGAAALCAKAALRSGAGLVSIACPYEIVSVLQTLVPCAMCIPMVSFQGAINEEALPELQKALAGKTAVAIGPGLSRKVSAAIIAAVLDSRLPAVIDADALNIIAENRELADKLGPRHIITPHPGEAARLLGRKIENPVEDARALAKLGPNVVLKGASRVICLSGYDSRPRSVINGNIVENFYPGKTAVISASGCSGMARGGSGDILTGLLGGLLADKLHAVNPLRTAAIACEIHGLAGEKAQARYGVRAMNAADILEFLPEVFREYAD